MSSAMLVKMESFSCISCVLVFSFLLGHATTKRTNSINNVITIFQNLGPRMCQQRCSQIKACKTVSFKRSSLYCELLKDHSPSMLVDDTEFMLYDSGSFEVTESACWPNPCTVQQKCIIVNSGSICVTHRNRVTSDEINLIIKERKYKIKDIALGKHAYQYPDYPLSSLIYDGKKASNAIDGKSETFSHTYDNDATKHHGDIYLMIDLQNDFLVKRVDMINRLSCCAHRLRKVDITVGLTETNQTFCGHFAGPGTLGQHITIFCPKMLLGRFVKLTYTEKTYIEPILSVAEVSVFAYA